MKNINTAPISGMQELLPEAQAIFNELKSKIEGVYRGHGYLNIETPVIERDEVLLAKAGGDTEKQIYRVFKTAETANEADQALRFDHTVPLARYVVEHENDLVFPFKVSQVGRNFRGERAQKGRFREFYQCDVDVVGRGSLPLYYDADVIATLIDTLRQFKLGTLVRARVSNRKILNGLLTELGLDEKAGAIFSIIDHAEKASIEETKYAMKEEGLDDDLQVKMLDFMNLHGDRSVVVAKLREMGIENKVFRDGVDELDVVLRWLEGEGADDSVEVIADMQIVRGLDYYTGTVFEFVLPDYKKVGSVCGGGRYENLAGYFTDQLLPGVGGSIGLTRLFYVLNEQKLLHEAIGRPLEYAVVPISDAEIAYAVEIASELRSQGHTVTVVVLPTNKKLGDKLNYAGKLASKGIVIGESEVASQSYTVKELR